MQTGGRCHCLVEVIVGGETRGSGSDKRLRSAGGVGCSGLVGLLRCECEVQASFCTAAASWSFSLTSLSQFNSSMTGIVAHGAAALQ